MVIFEDIKQNIEINGGHIKKVNLYDNQCEIIYINSDGIEIVQKYSFIINDDGSENCIEVT